MRSAFLPFLRHSLIRFLPLSLFIISSPSLALRRLFPSSLSFLPFYLLVLFIQAIISTLFIFALLSFISSLFIPSFPYSFILLFIIVSLFSFRFLLTSQNLSHLLFSVSHCFILSVSPLTVSGPPSQPTFSPQFMVFSFTVFFFLSPVLLLLFTTSCESFVKELQNVRAFLGLMLAMRFSPPFFLFFLSV